MMSPSSCHSFHSKEFDMEDGRERGDERLAYDILEEKTQIKK
jgi:hypothetical protein